MTRMVYIAELRSGGIDFVKDELKNGDTPEPICEPQSHFVLWESIVHDVHTNKVPNSRIIDCECCFIRMTKAEMIPYLEREVHFKQPPCFYWMGDKEGYEKMASEEIEYLLLVLSDASDDKEFLLVACDLYDESDFADYDK